MFRYFAGFIATIALIILLIVLIFHGGGGKVQKTSKSLVSYATTDAEVSVTIDGPIVADQNHQAVKITVSNDSAVFEAIQGYQGSVTKQQSYPNNTAAFTNFLYALQYAGFTKGDTTSTSGDERGYCPLGQRYIFQLNQDGKQLERYWVTSCSGTPKTFNGSANLILNLFQAQIPDYSSLSSGISL